MSMSTRVLQTARVLFDHRAETEGFVSTVHRCTPNARALLKLTGTELPRCIRHAHLPPVKILFTTPPPLSSLRMRWVCVFSPLYGVFVNRGNGDNEDRLLSRPADAHFWYTRRASAMVWTP